MRIVIRVAVEPGAAAQDPEPDLSRGGVVTVVELPSFTAVPSGRRGFPLAMVASLGLHLVGAVIVRETIRITSAPEINVVKQMIAESRVEHLLLRVPPRQPLLLPRIRNVVAKAATSAGDGVSPSRPSTEAASQATELAPSRATAVLLQPNRLTPEVVAPVDIRSFTVWSGPSPRKTPAPIVAGAVEPVAATIVAGLTSLPELPVPEPASLTVPSPPIPSDRAGLTLPASGSTPLKSVAPPTPPGSSTVGEPAAVIAISSAPPVPNEVVVIPPGNYLIIGSDGASTKSGGSTPKPPAADRSESTKREPPKTVQASAKVPAEPGPDARSEGKAAAPQSANAGTAKPAPSPAETARAEQLRTDMAAKTDVQIPSSRTIQTASGTIQVRGNNDGSTLLTYPRDGQFDIVVIQSGAPEEAGDLSALLSGKPVHTVFIQVGAPREWVLQYCLPESAASGARQSGMVVNLGSPAPLKAPFVLEAHLPPGAAWRSKAHQVFHGVLGQSGKLERLRAVKANASPGQLMDYLSRWTFRPATSGKESRLVEVLLIIPPDPAA